MRTDFHSLTGAYALNALPAFERERFEAHLKRCPMCADEVAELREAAARVGAAAAVDPPERLRERVLNEVAQTRQRPPEIAPEPRRTSWLPVASSIVAAASLVVAIALGIQLGQVNERLSDETEARQLLAQQYEEFATLITAEDAQMMTTTMESGGAATAVVAHSHGAALFVTHDLEPLPEELAYQLWVLGPDGSHSPGLIENYEQDAVLARGIGEGSQLAVTIEPAGGSPQGTTDPIMVMPVD
ncbi:anti-sigma factor [Hoyosella altamirensis]|uniref:Regulator of SigK n=1 Tax=Hoyosella altamirensis TaxID=616997 RepID=A0A839RQ74_9ACTN|nr:anti-sigma factor [Hoyosella altamirensis]MBB3039142.1 anti-sigma-K factor RskA [Hoyosella altamirensis]